MQNMPKIFCAVDTPDMNEAIKIAKSVKDICGVKLGLTFFNKHGSDGIQKVVDESGVKALFLDLKCHDIPAQIGGAVKSLGNLAPDYLTIHASGGLEMMQAAKENANPNMKILAVTVLTSLNSYMLADVGQDTDAQAQVVRLALLAQKAGLDGVICSPLEIEAIRNACGEDFILMVPGIRPEGSSKDDQQRVMTPKQAVDKGATHLVIGRPITKSDDPVLAAQAILDSIA